MTEETAASALPGEAPAARTAKAYERKKRRSRLVLALEARSPLQSFFTGGVEFDDRIDLELVRSFTADFEFFKEALEVPPTWGHDVELKLRRLGNHRADGLYYPDQRVLVLDPASTRSFAHELGHLLDYRADHCAPGETPRPVLSAGAGFAPFRDRMLARMRGSPNLGASFWAGGGRVSGKYYASESECFARAFEQLAAELLPEPCTLTRERTWYRGDPFFFEAVPLSLLDYFRGVLADVTLQPACAEGRAFAASRVSALPGRARAARERLACRLRASIRRRC